MSRMQHLLIACLTLTMIAAVARANTPALDAPALDTFVNGDYYVVGPVTVTAIDPAPREGLNGRRQKPLAPGDRDARSSCGKRPVTRLAREGTHNGCVQYDRSKRTPASAMGSIAGVCRSVLPVQLMALAAC